jgi:hypothetical protein
MAKAHRVAMGTEGPPEDTTEGERPLHTGEHQRYPNGVRIWTCCGQLDSNAPCEIVITRAAKDLSDHNGSHRRDCTVQ